MKEHFERLLQFPTLYNSFKYYTSLINTIKSNSAVWCPIGKKLHSEFFLVLSAVTVFRVVDAVVATSFTLKY